MNKELDLQQPVQAGKAAAGRQRESEKDAGIIEMEQPLVKISVRNLVEFIMRGGDIDNRMAGADKDTMLL